ncbi:MAG TPA: carboxypeptidase regulatory-like domain-containing protein [Vicinamibacterales bacterium]|nr:carboxypeptidase regulatory-like domain-containing protein [Vicinamibacterales bacterium]
MRAVAAAACAVLAVLLRPVAAQQDQAGTGLIIGQVLEAGSDRPIAGVIVTLAPASPGASTARPASPLRAMTDARGRFVLRDIDSGRYLLTASVGGNGFSPSGLFVSGSGQQIGAYLNGGYGQRRPGGPLTTIEIADGQAIADAAIRLWKGAAIEGTVVDEAGEPFVGLFVAAARRDRDGRLSNGPSTHTDDRGWYRLGALLPGEYLVVVPQKQNVFPAAAVASVALAPRGSPAARPFGDTTAQAQPSNGLRVGSMIVSAGTSPDTTNMIPPHVDGDVVRVYRTTFHPSATTSRRATPVRVEAGETRRSVDIRLEPQPVVPVSGTVVDASGPVPNFGVRLMPADADDGSSVLEAATTATDARGAFVFPLVPAGSYTLRAERSLPAPGAMNTGGRPSDLSGASAMQPIAVGSTPVTNVALVIRPGANVRGRAEFTGAADRPVGGLRTTMTLVPTPPVYRSPGTLHGSVVNGQGQVSFSTVVPGRYLITANSTPPWTLVSVMAGGRDLTDRTFDLDSDIDDLVVTFIDAPAAISGSVRVPSGTAADAMSVVLFPSDRARWRDASAATRSFQATRVSTSGAFNIPAVIPGSYVIAAIHEEDAVDWPDTALLTSLAGIGRTIVVEPRRQLTVTLDPVAVRRAP